MKLRVNTVVVVLLESPDEQVRWDDISLGEKLKILNSLGVTDIDGCHIKDPRYNSGPATTNIVYLDRPRLVPELQAEIERMRKGVDEISAARKAKDTSHIDKEHWTKHDDQVRSLQQAAGLLKVDREVKTSPPRNVDVKPAAVAIQTIPTTPDLVTSRATKTKAEKMKTMTLSDMGYGDIDANAIGDD